MARCAPIGANMNLKIGEWVRYSPAFIKSIAAPELARVYGVIRADNGPVRPYRCKHESKNRRMG
jgi:hypothetical protein